MTIYSRTYDLVVNLSIVRTKNVDLEYVKQIDDWL